IGKLLNQLFLGTGPTGALPGGARPGGTTPGTTTTFSGGGTGVLNTGAGGPDAGGFSVTVDDRTNSVIVAASPGVLVNVEALIYTLDEADVEPRRNEVVQLHNAHA